MSKESTKPIKKIWAKPVVLCFSIDQTNDGSFVGPYEDGTYSANDS